MLQHYTAYPKAQHHGGASSRGSDSCGSSEWPGASCVHEQKPIVFMREAEPTTRKGLPWLWRWLHRSRRSAEHGKGDVLEQEVRLVQLLPPPGHHWLDPRLTEEVLEICSKGNYISLYL
jgi:hypothetical protein